MKMRRCFFRLFITSALCFIFLCSVIAPLPIIAQAQQITEMQNFELVQSLSAYKTDSQNNNLINLTNNHIYNKMSNYGERIIAEVKSLKDFNGNDYTLFELEPTGYIIYSNETGIYFEYSASSSSPYLGYNDNLYYGSMKAYYRKVGTQYISTLFPDEVLNYDQISALTTESKIINERNIESKDTINLQYINGEITLSQLNSIKLNLNTNISIQSSSNPQPDISMADFFTNLTEANEMGYRGGNVCGYIAANLVLAYNDFAYENGLVPDNYLDRVNKKINGVSLTNKLLEYGGQDPANDSFDGTDANRMGEIVRAFIAGESDVQKPWAVTTWWFAINAQGAISKNQPPILFGNYNAPSKSSNFTIQPRGTTNHAVVAYGYSTDGYRVHFGWSGRADVNLSVNAIGSTMILSFF